MHQQEHEQMYEVLLCAITSAVWGETSALMFRALFLKYTICHQHICINNLSMYTSALWTSFAPVVPEADAPDVDGEGSGTGKCLRCFGLLLPFPTAPSGSNTSCWRIHQEAIIMTQMCSHRKLTYPNSVWLHPPQQ